MHDQTPLYYRGGSLAFALLVAAGLWAIEAVPGSILARLLSLGPIRWIGWISYSLYLWHWPMIVWIGDRRPVSSTFACHLLEIAATFVLARAVNRRAGVGDVLWKGT